MDKRRTSEPPVRTASYVRSRIGEKQEELRKKYNFNKY